jgi:hypothetical protein
MKIFFAILILIIISIIIYYNKNNEGFENKNAIVCLTRGYDELNKYDTLINRNKSIHNMFNINDYDIIIFNEGNITIDQQQHIQNQTPDMKIQFISIKFYNNTEQNDICKPTTLSNNFSLGYKNMCYFWSIDFLEYLKKYDYIIRVDEDCIIDKIDKNIINNYKKDNIMFSSAYFQGNDELDVTIGMDDLFNSYLKKNNLIKKNDLKCPYTNFMIINIPYFKNNKNVQNILQEIKNSNCIFSNRWGDLPIWGYILSYLIDKKYYIEDKNITYKHGSHDMIIN